MKKIIKLFVCTFFLTGFATLSFAQQVTSASSNQAAISEADYEKCITFCKGLGNSAEREICMKGCSNVGNTAVAKPTPVKGTPVKIAPVKSVKPTAPKQ